MLLLHILLYSSLLFINDALTTLTYTTSSPAPTYVNCDDLTGCEIICTGDNTCELVSINVTSASYLTIIASGDYVLSRTEIYCPTNGVCDISAGGKRSFRFVDVFAQKSTKLTVTAHGGYDSFSPNVHCPRNQETPSCIIKLRSDSSPFWNSSIGGPIMEQAWFYTDSADELQFQCDADTNWDALFGSENSFFYHGETSHICDIELSSYDSSDFFATNQIICDGFFNNKQCVSWSSESTESTKTPSVLPTESPTNFPILSPSKHPTISPTKLDTITLSTKQPPSSPFDIDVLSTAILSTSNHIVSTTINTMNEPTSTPTKPANDLTSITDTTAAPNAVATATISTILTHTDLATVHPTKHSIDETTSVLLTHKQSRLPFALSTIEMVLIVFISTACCLISSFGMIYYQWRLYKKKPEQKENIFNAENVEKVDNIEEECKDEDDESVGNKYTNEGDTDIVVNETKTAINARTIISGSAKVTKRSDEQNEKAFIDKCTDCKANTKEMEFVDNKYTVEGYEEEGGSANGLIKASTNDRLNTINTDVVSTTDACDDI